MGTLYKSPTKRTRSALPGGLNPGELRLVCWGTSYLDGVDPDPEILPDLWTEDVRQGVIAWWHDEERTRDPHWSRVPVPVGQWGAPPAAELILYPVDKAAKADALLESKVPAWAWLSLDGRPPRRDHGESAWWNASALHRYPAQAGKLPLLASIRECFIEIGAWPESWETLGAGVIQAHTRQWIKENPDYLPKL